MLGCRPEFCQPHAVPCAPQRENSPATRTRPSYFPTPYLCNGGGFLMTKKPPSAHNNFLHDEAAVISVARGFEP